MQQQWVDIIGNIKEQVRNEYEEQHKRSLEEFKKELSNDLQNFIQFASQASNPFQFLNQIAHISATIGRLRQASEVFTYSVECKEFFYRHLPELDDSIADKLLLGCTTAEQKCQEVEQTAREQVTDNAILDQISKTVQVDIPQSLFEEQGRQLYGANLLEIQVLVASCIIFRPIRQHKFQHV
ncbi:hypothetical protein JHK87_033956 [Glycine soja]|nr:hypothetical protein JHK87_033956 [Glycine soja]